MGKIEDTIYENYRQAIADGDFEQAKKAAEFGQILQSFIESNNFRDYHTHKVPTSKLMGKFFSPFSYKYDPERGIVELDSSVISLTASENKLFYLFSMNESKGKDIKVVSALQICKYMWGGNVNQGALRIAIYRLRKKIEPDANNPQVILSFPSKGYVFLGNKVSE